MMFLEVAKLTQYVTQWHMLVHALDEKLQMQMESTYFLVHHGAKHCIGSAEHTS